MKTEVYSWRVSTEVKTDLEQAARRRNVSVSALLDIAAREWLKNTASNVDEAQETLHRAASACFGTIAGGNARRAESVRETLRKRLHSKHGR